MKPGKSVKSTLPRPVYVGSPTRSPIGKFGGVLKIHTAPQLAALTLKECVRRSGRSALQVDAVYMGHARQAGAGPNPARQASIGAGLPDSVPALTLNQACASGMTAILHAAERLALNRASLIFAGGVESMTHTPYLLPQARWGQRMGHGQVLDGMHQDGFFCPLSQQLMGATVENFVVPEFGITREAQDRFAYESQEKAAKAHKEGAFDAEICALAGGPKGQDLISSDEHPRATSLERLSQLAPVFETKTGTITAGNSSGITDGAAFLELSTEVSADSVAEILDWETVALDPRRMGVAPIPAIQNLLKRHDLQVTDLAAIELNEAFAAQVLACQQTLKIPNALLNKNGGAIALGHPIGATGARITVTLLHTLRSYGSGSLGVAALCVSGGHGVAVLLRSL